MISKLAIFFKLLSLINPADTKLYRNKSSHSWYELTRTQLVTFFDSFGQCVVKQIHKFVFITLFQDCAYTAQVFNIGNFLKSALGYGQVMDSFICLLTWLTRIKHKTYGLSPYQEYRLNRPSFGVETVGIVPSCCLIKILIPAYAK